MFAVSPVGVASQENADADALEVRIAARRVAGERIEFALQQRPADGTWGPRSAPRQRLFPLSTAEGRWLTSTPLTLARSRVEARIVARRVAGERIEFALQHREADGAWAAPLLPQRRLFPVATALGRWLASSPLAVRADHIEPSPPAPSPPAAEPRIDPFEELASLVLEETNNARRGLAPLQIHDGLSAAARARAEAQASSDDWQLDFDYDARLAHEWGVWFASRSARINSELSNLRLVGRLSDALLREGSQASVVCDLCTHFGIGAATRHGHTYATVVVAGPAPPADVIADAEAETAGLVNELRESLGVDPLTYHSAVAAVARRWSQTLADENVFHHNPHYSEQYPPGWQTAAENIALQTGNALLSAAVQQAFDGLVNSPGHYGTMIDPRLTHLGVGVAVRGNRVVVTQNFARYPLGT